MMGKSWSALLVVALAAGVPVAALPPVAGPADYFLGRDLMPGHLDELGRPLPIPWVSGFTASGFDFIAHSAWGRANGYTVKSNGTLQYVGLGNAFAILDTTLQTSPYVRGWVDLPTTLQSISYPGSGTLAYAAAGSSIYVIDVSNTQSPFVVGSLNPAGSSSTVVDIQVNGSDLYAAMQSDGIRVINVATPSAPTLTGTCNTPGSATGLFVSGTTVFVADGTSGLQVVNASNPASPFISTFLDTPGVAREVVLNGSGTHIYVSDGNVGAGASIRTMTNTTPPVLTNSIAETQDPAGTVVVGSTLYVTLGSTGLRIFSISTPGVPALQGTFDTPGFAGGVDVQNNRAYISDNGSVQIVNVTVPSTPTFVSSYAVIDNGTEIGAEGNLVFIGASNLLGIVDVSIPQRPRVLSKFTVSSGILGMKVSGTRVYLALGTTGMQIIDVSTPTSPVVLSTCNTPDSATDIALTATHAFVADGTSGLQVVDLAAPTVVAGSVDTGTANGVAVQGSLAYVADVSGLVVVDVATPATPVIRSTTTLTTTAQSVAVSGTKAYVGTGIPGSATGGVEIVDVTSPLFPAWLSILPAPAIFTAVGDVEVLGTTCYAGTTGTLPSDGLRVIDVSNPLAPVETGSFVSAGQTGTGAVSVDLEGGFVHMSDGFNGAFMLQEPDACEVFEPNDTYATAWPITVGASYDGFVCNASDLDYYSLAVASGGAVGGQMHPPGGLDYDLFLYDPAGLLVDSSMQAGSATESVGVTATAAGTYRFLVRGHTTSQWSASLYYTLVPTFSSCAAIPNEVYLYPSPTLDANGNVVLHIQDPNQLPLVTGYNVYRATAPGGPFTLLAQDVKDMDEGTPNVQFTDVGSNVGGPYFYQVRAFNGTCGSEGP